MFKDFKSDFVASIVVFFVAFPLCLGVALASGAPLFAGIVAGVVGGIVVGAASGSSLGVSGPAAGMAVIVLSAISTLGSWPAFLLAVILAGVFQIMMGYAKVGFIAYFFSSSVIKGMLAGIGLLIIMKQIPHALGYDYRAFDEITFNQPEGQISFTDIEYVFRAITPAAMLISVLSLTVLICWDTILLKKHKIFQLIQGPIVVVLLGIVLNLMFQAKWIDLSLLEEHVVKIPVPNSVGEFFTQLTFPDFSAITSIEVWKIALLMAVVASLETLLSVEAVDRLDPRKRKTPTNRELKAQGLGNIVSGLLGGLPITQVIVRSSANIAFGGKTKKSTIMHGFWILISAATMAGFLNLIPLASLAAVLIMIGYKLAKPAIFKQMYQSGSEQFVPFMATIVGIVAIDLLKGILIGTVISIFYTLRHSYRNAYYVKDDAPASQVHHLVLAEEVPFFYKASIIKALDAISPDSKVIIDCSNSKFIAQDVFGYISDFRENAQYKNITVEVIGA